MDPISGLSFACNVLDMVDRAIRYGKTIKEIYDSTTGLSDSNENLDSITKSMVTVAEDLQYLQGQITQSRPDPKMQEVAEECHAVCIAIQEILTKCKPKKEKSVLSAASASIRSFLNKSDLEKFQAKLDKSVQSLHSLLAVKTYQDAEVIKALLKASSAHVIAQLEAGRIQQSTISEKLVSLEARLSVGLNSGTSPGQLQTIIDFMKQASNTMKITAILKNLHFPSMHERFRNVRECAPDTFDWIFHDPKKLLVEEKELDISFTDWLRSGSGIFHIAGKPGSGKSTLMKFICEHAEVTQLLQEWGGSRDTISARFFFWRVGSVDDKSLGGLIRGLLFAVIQQEPDLARLLFPRFWNSDSQDRTFSSSINLTDREISNAFDEMTRNETLLEKFRMCFFIDGLDEFEQTESATHYTLTQKIWEWVSKSKGNVKFCVASREMPVFENAFRANQRITIQTFTRGDIEMLVSRRLGENVLFQRLKEKHESTCEKLMEEIVVGAEGVFLWVVLLLTQLEESLASGDSITMLEGILKKAPKELDVFFQSILESIPERYRESAYAIFAIVMRNSGILLNKSKREAKYENVDSLAQLDGCRISLVGCSFVFDVCDKGVFSDLPTDFPLYSGEDEKEDRIRHTKSQLKARCRGLLDCQNTDILFTHRSIPEFLQRAFNQNTICRHIDDHLVAEWLTWSILGELKYGIKDGTWIASKGTHSPGDRAGYMAYIFRQMECGSWSRAFQFFREMDGLLCIQKGMAKLPENECDYGLIQQYGTNQIAHASGGFLSIAACTGFHEYVAWELTTNPLLKKAKYYGVNALASCVGFENSYNTLFHGDTLEALFGGGVSVDAAYPHYGKLVGAKDVLLWHYWLVCYLFTDPASRAKPSETMWLKRLPNYVWHNIEIWLRHGANPDLRLSMHIDPIILPHDVASHDEIEEEDGGSLSGSVESASLRVTGSRLEKVGHGSDIDAGYVLVQGDEDDSRDDQDGAPEKDSRDDQDDAPEEGSEDDQDDAAEDEIELPSQPRSETLAISRWDEKKYHQPGRVDSWPGDLGERRWRCKINVRWIGDTVWTFDLPVDPENFEEGESSALALENLFGSSGMAITLEDFIKFRNPTGSDEIIQLMQRNRLARTEATSKVAIDSEPLSAKSDAQESFESDRVTGHGKATQLPEFTVQAKHQGISSLRQVWTHPATWITFNVLLVCLVAYFLR